MSGLPAVSTRTWKLTLYQPFRSATPFGAFRGSTGSGFIASGDATFSTSMFGLATARFVASRQSPRAMGASRFVLMRAPTVCGSGCVSGDFLEHAAVASAAIVRTERFLIISWRNDGRFDRIAARVKQLNTRRRAQVRERTNFALRLACIAHLPPVLDEEV